MNELNKRTDDWDETRVKKKIRIGRYIPKRRKIREKEFSTIYERRAVEKDVIKIAYRFVVM
jgi:hypothetical protein